MSSAVRFRTLSHCNYSPPNKLRIPGGGPAGEVEEDSNNCRQMSFHPPPSIGKLEFALFGRQAAFLQDEALSREVRS